MPFFFSVVVFFLSANYRKELIWADDFEKNPRASLRARVRNSVVVGTKVCLSVKIPFILNR